MTQPTRRVLKDKKLFPYGLCYDHTGEFIYQGIWGMLGDQPGLWILDVRWMASN